MVKFMKKRVENVALLSEIVLGIANSNHKANLEIVGQSNIRKYLACCKGDVVVWRRNTPCLTFPGLFTTYHTKEYHLLQLKRSQDVRVCLDQLNGAFSKGPVVTNPHLSTIHLILLLELQTRATSDEEDLLGG